MIHIVLCDDMSIEQSGVHDSDRFGFAIARNSYRDFHDFFMFPSLILPHLRLRM